MANPVDITSAALPGLTIASNIKTAAREIDFVTRFQDNWDALRDILGIMRPIRKEPGSKLVSYHAVMVGELKGGASVGEGELIPFTEFKVEPASYGDITVEKYADSISLESVAEKGAANAVGKTDDAFLVALQNVVLNRFYRFVKTGSLTGSQKTWQRALAIAKGSVLNRFAGMRKNVTEVVGFANIMDFYDYLGDANVSTQTMFGLNYIQNFLGYKTLLLLPDELWESGYVCALPIENIDLYYIDPSDSDFAELGLNYTVSGETNLIGFHSEGDYSRGTGNTYAVMGMTLWAEYLDGISVVKIDPSADNKKPTVTVPSEGDET